MSAAQNVPADFFDSITGSNIRQLHIFHFLYIHFLLNKYHICVSAQKVLLIYLLFFRDFSGNKSFIFLPNFTDIIAPGHPAVCQL